MINMDIAMVPAESKMIASKSLSPSSTNHNADNKSVYYTDGDSFHRCKYATLPYMPWPMIISGMPYMPPSPRISW